MVHKEVSSSGELYVYVDGVLVYKKWPTGQSVVFEKYGPNTWKGDRDRGALK